MLYEIKNRAEARAATYAKDAPITAIISITDIGDEKNKFYPQYWLKYILELQFNDYEAGSTGCITKAQAKDIAEFVLCAYPKVERFIVHCEFGQSRSAGVAAALCHYFEGSSDEIFKNRAYCPNRTCYRYVLEALSKKKKR